MTTIEERQALAALTRVGEPGDPHLVDLVAASGPVEVWERLRTGALDHPAAASWAVRVTGYQPEKDLARAAACGARLVCRDDEEWPSCLDDLAEARSLDRRPSSLPGVRPQTEVSRGGVPLALWVRGRVGLDAMCARAVAIVGSRAASAYGGDVATDVAYGVARRGVTVVSGAAYGIDVAAHRGALAADGPTVAVLACGVDVSYPRGHTTLLERVVEDGLVVSEVPPGCAPSRLRFLTRNRLIAALTQGTVVVEAALRSGALNTARWAEQMSRPVLGIPGPVTSQASAGVHQMIRDGLAGLVTDADEVLETIAPLGSELTGRRVGAARLVDYLDDAAARVLEAVPSQYAVGDERIARTAGLPPGEVQTKLGLLLLSDLVEQRDGRWRLSARRRQAVHG